MQEYSKLFLVSVTMTILIMSVNIGFSDELIGKVMKTIGKQVEIKLERDLIPQIGDEVIIGFNMPSVGFIPLQGKWNVSAVNSDTITADPDGDTRRPQKDQIAKIISPNPLSRKSMEIASRDATDNIENMNDTGVEVESGALLVDTVPLESKIRILNIKPRYYRGIDLVPGKYHLEVSAPDHKIKNLWINILPGEKKHISLFLEKSVTINANRDKTEERGKKYSKYLIMLRSDNYGIKAKAAKIIYKRKLFESEILEVVDDELMKGFQKIIRDRYHVDCMAWLCKVLGVSNQTQYIESLEKVVRTANNKKIRKYAAWSLRRIR